MIINPTPSAPRSLDELLPPGLAAGLDRVDVLSRKVFAGKLPGERRSKRRGRSVEFDDYRGYTPGDDLRHLDWNVFARLDRFFIKLFREEEDLELRVIVDASPSMLAGGTERPAGPAPREGREPARPPQKLTHALRLAMALGYVGLVNQNRVSAASFGSVDPVAPLAPVRGRREVRRLADYLIAVGEAARVPTAGETPPPFDEALRGAAGSGRGVVVLISDMLHRDEPAGRLARGLAFLAGGRGRGGGYDATVLRVLAAGELDPGRNAPAGFLGDLRLTDIESGRGSEITVSKELLRSYQKRLAANIASVEAACRSRGIDHLLVSTDTPVEETVLGGLRKRRLVG